MHSLFRIFASLLALTLVVTGLLLIVAPGIGRWVLQRTAISTGIFVILFVTFDSVMILLSSHPFVFIMVAVVLCITANVVRERRVQHSERGGIRQSERTPVIPTHLGGGVDA